MVVTVEEFAGEEILTTATLIKEVDPLSLDQSTVEHGLFFQSKRTAARKRIWDLAWEEASPVTVTMIFAHYQSKRFVKFRFNRLTGTSAGPVVQYVSSPLATWNGILTASLSLQLIEVTG